jgi:hypothetical protein
MKLVKVLLVLGFALIAGCSMLNLSGETKAVLLGDLSTDLAGYQDTVEDPFLSQEKAATLGSPAGTQVHYVVCGMEKYDGFAKNAAVIYASLVAANYYLAKTNADIAALDPADAEGAQKMATDNLERLGHVAAALTGAIAKAPEMVVQAQELITSASSDFTGADMAKLPAVITALNGAVENLGKVNEEGEKVQESLGATIDTLKVKAGVTE